APDAFGGIVAMVPFVDALTSILDPTLPLTIPEWEEWGDPLHDPEVYRYMKSYTPYENVASGLPTRRSWRSPASTTPGCLITSRPSGSRSCRPTPPAGRSCSRPRCRRGTAGAAAATTPGTRRPWCWPGSSLPRRPSSGGRGLRPGERG